MENIPKRFPDEDFTIVGSGDEEGRVGRKEDGVDGFFVTREDSNKFPLGCIPKPNFLIFRARCILRQPFHVPDNNDNELVWKVMKY